MSSPSDRGSPSRSDAGAASSSGEGSSAASRVEGALAERAESALARAGVTRDQPLVVGCSGGADSTALLDALAAWGATRLVAAYVDHGLRAATETAAEALLVERLAARCGAAFERLAIAVPRRGNLLAAAREARYEALGALCLRRGARWLLVGHTATDQAETVLFRAERGDPPVAAAGMSATRPLGPPSSERARVTLVRPLLAVRRDETRAYCAARALPFVDDPSNQRTDRTRARLRLTLDGDANAQAALLTRAAAAATARAVAEAAARALGPVDDLAASVLATASDETLFALLRQAGLLRAGRAHVAAVRRLAASTSGTREIHLGEGLVAERRYDRLRLGPPSPPDPGDLEQPLVGPGSYPFPSGVVLARLDEGAEVPSGLCLRNSRPGDWLRTPFGRRNLKEVMIDRRVPRPDRRRLPLLSRSGSAEVLWGAGLDGAFRRDGRVATGWTLRYESRR